LSADRVGLSLWHNFGNSAITRVVRDTPALNERFRRTLADILEGPAHPDRMAARIDEIFRQIRGDVYSDPYKLITNDQFDYFRGYLKDVFRRRYDHLHGELAAH
ncbi:MAG TPA: CotH kinase family protein, partial [Planctomycetota bacterium]|nr:CotH kinase family protein [Planctomycetota bacterium]